MRKRKVKGAEGGRGEKCGLGRELQFWATCVTPFNNGCCKFCLRMQTTCSSSATAVAAVVGRGYLKLKLKSNSCSTFRTEKVKSLKIKAAAIGLTF